MKRNLGRFSIVLLSLLMATGFGLVACGGNGNGTKDGGNGDGSGPCPNPELPYLCPQDNACHECCVNDDCLDDEACNADFECEKLCTPEDGDCSRDRGSCCEGLACDVFSNVCTECCTTDSCQTTHSHIPFAADLKCEDCVCDFAHCTNDSGCPPGLVCFDHDCVTKPNCDDLANCVVAPPSVVTQEGTQAGFAATALMNSGALAPGFDFDWASSDDTIATVAAGTVTGGATTGEATITASVAGCESDCSATPVVNCCTAKVINYGPVDAGDTRVVVVDELEGTPIVDVTVEIDGTTVVTDAAGVAEFTGLEVSDTNPQDIHLFSKEYIYMTLRQVETNDIIAHLLKLHNWDFSQNPPVAQAGGVRGKPDYGLIPCLEGHTCDVLISFAGLSIPGNLVNLNIETLIGGWINTVFDIPGLNFETVLPAGVTACLGEQCFVEYYKPTGVPGKRVFWGLGAKVDLNEIIAIAGPLISGGGAIQVGKLLNDIMPLVETAYTSVIPNQDIVAIPKVPDVDDIDANPNTTEVPDYDNFSPLHMTPKVPMDQELTINVPPFPSRTEGWHYDGVLLLAGVLVKGAGMVPLGINAGIDSLDDTDPADGAVESPIVMKVSDVAGRLPEDQVQRLVLALALHIGDLSADEPQPFVLGGQVVYLGDSFETTVNLDPFLAAPAIDYDEVTRHLEVTGIPAEADYGHAIFSTGDGSTFWHVLGEWAEGGYDIPPAPATGDRAETATFVAIDLIDGLDFADLPDFNDNNMDDMAVLVQNFVVVGEAGAGIGGMDCEDCSTGGTGGLVSVSMLVLVGLILFSWRRRK